MKKIIFQFEFSEIDRCQMAIKKKMWDRFNFCSLEKIPCFFLAVFWFLKLRRFWILQLLPTSSEVMHTFTSRKRLNSEDHCIEVSIESKKAKIMENFSALTPKNGLNPKPAGGGAKKLVIKNLKAKPTLPDNFQVNLINKINKKELFCFQFSFDEFFSSNQSVT